MREAQGQVPPPLGTKPRCLRHGFCRHRSGNLWSCQTLSKVLIFPVSLKPENIWVFLGQAVRVDSSEIAVKEKVRQGVVKKAHNREALPVWSE